MTRQPDIGKGSSGTRSLCFLSSRRMVCRGTTMLPRGHCVTWQFNGRSQVHSARRARAITCVSSLSRRLAASSKNRSSAFSYPNLRTWTNTEIGAERIQTGLPTLGKKNDAHVLNLPCNAHHSRKFVAAGNLNVSFGKSVPGRNSRDAGRDPGETQSATKHHQAD